MPEKGDPGSQFFPVSKKYTGPFATGKRKRKTRPIQDHGQIPVARESESVIVSPRTNLLGSKPESDGLGDTTRPFNDKGFKVDIDFSKSAEK